MCKWHSDSMHSQYGNKSFTSGSEHVSSSLEEHGASISKEHTSSTLEEHASSPVVDMPTVSEVQKQ